MSHLSKFNPSNTLKRRSPQSIILIAGFALIGLIATLGCSLGALIVQAPTPTATRFKTPQPTFTFTPDWTPTFTPSPTPTITNTPVPTDTPVPTSAAESETEGEPAAEAQPAEPAAEVAAEPPPAPPDTPTPEPPTATPAPSYPFTITPNQHSTGSPGETRLTAWIAQIYSEPGKFKTLPNYRMKVIAPDGETYFSEVSGDGFADSTAPGTGDNHRMNTKLEIRPYQPGTYRVSLVDGNDTQMSPEFELNLSADPLQYVHFDFFRQAEE